MTMTDDTKLPLTSDNPTEALLAQLREQTPHVFSEGKVDWEKLKATLGEAIDARPERYGLTWAGKAEAFRAVQSPSVGTLLPMPEESVNFDSSENLIIEGDNLEVLKLLQKSYHGKVKMIYIDPPYNTGNEFIYPDNYREGLDDYLRYSGQVSEEGLKQSTNTETSGRFHSKWLSMMYPRLFMARNLLRDDGVIFVSIDDHEVHNLRMLMNEVFGEENFVASVIWQKNYAPKSSARHFSEDHDYVLVYAKYASTWMPNLLARTEEQNAVYRNTDNDPRGPWRPNNLSARNYYSKGMYSIRCPGGRVIEGPPTGRYWVVSEEKFREMDRDNRIYWGADGNNIPAPKIFLSEVKQGRVPQTLWFYDDVGHTQEAKKDLISLVAFSDSDSVFDTPKPARLIKRMLQLATKPGEKPDARPHVSDMTAEYRIAGQAQKEISPQEIVLDFFAGSGTTAQAVIEQNNEDGGNRKFILVQLPEKTENSQYPTIAHITRERVRRVIAKLNEADAGKLDLGDKAKQDRGFRAFKLSSSNFKIWDADRAATESAQLAEQLHLYADNLAESRSRQDVLCELIIKSGLPLTAKVETRTVAEKTVHSIADGNLLICLEKPVTQELLRGMIALEPLQILCLDAAFHGNDPLKTNAVLEAKSHGITFRTV